MMSLEHNSIRTIGHLAIWWRYTTKREHVSKASRETFEDTFYDKQFQRIVEALINDIQGDIIYEDAKM